jgi:hypothetical protein
MLINSTQIFQKVPVTYKWDEPTNFMPTMRHKLRLPIPVHYKYSLEAVWRRSTVVGLLSNPNYDHVCTHSLCGMSSSCSNDNGTNVTSTVNSSHEYRGVTVPIALLVLLTITQTLHDTTAFHPTLSQLSSHDKLNTTSIVRHEGKTRAGGTGRHNIKLN